MGAEIIKGASVKANCKSHYSADIDGLYLAEDLLGNYHCFKYKGHSVEIRMPLPNEVDKFRAAGSHVVGDEQIPFLSQVKIVDVHIEIPGALECINIHDKNNVNPKHKLSNCDPDKLINELTSASIGAFSYWLDMVRLVTHDYNIGLRSRGPSSHEHASIVYKDSGKVICSGPVCLYSKIVDHGIESEVWNKVQSELDKGSSLPIHYQFLIDADHALEDNRFKSCIIDLAMACETYLRFSVFDVLERCPDDVKANMELANINAFTNGYFKNRVISSQKSRYEKLKKDHLNSLFDARNKLVHMGEEERVTRENCIRFLGATQDLFSVNIDSANRI
jgi:hypothetical protein